MTVINGLHGQVSFKFHSSTHHTKHAILVPRGCETYEQVKIQKTTSLCKKQL